MAEPTKRWSDDWIATRRQSDSSTGDWRLEIGCLYNAGRCSAGCDAITRGGAPDAVIIQSLFHDLQWAFEQSPAYVHGMHASKEHGDQWLLVWSTIAMAACAQ